MSERQAHRVVEKYTETPKSIGGDILATFSGKRVVFEGNVQPTEDDLVRIIEESRRMTDAASLGYDRQLASFETTGLDVQALRTGRLCSLMSRIGLQSLIPYETIGVINPKLTHRLPN